MAFIYFNINRQPCMGVRNENDLKLHRGDFDFIKADGRLKTVSDDDFNSYICGEKLASLDGDNVVISDQLIHPETAATDGENLTSEMFENDKNHYIKQLNKFLDHHSAKLSRPEFSDLNTRLQAFKTALENVDSSSISFPLNVNFERYWINNESVEGFDKSFIL